MLQFNMASMVEDVLQQHGKRLCDINMASRKAQEACMIMLITALFSILIIGDNLLLPFIGYFFVIMIHLL